MSGGIDSSVAAALMVKEGHSVVGITMRIYGGGICGGDSMRHACYGPDEDREIEAAREVCKQLNIDHHVFDLKDEFKNSVLDYFCREYRLGRTPNPCVVCNRQIKFGKLLDAALAGGIEFDFIATGHYAQCEYDTVARRYLLKKARDERKDQSYFLAFLSQEQLARTIFPLGNYTKDEVRRIAAGLGLKVKDEPESQDFISADYQAIVGPMPPGPIVDLRGKRLGTHRGLGLYTIGQRKGLGLSAALPLYVVDIDAKSNTLIVGRKAELLSSRLTAAHLNWIAIEGLDEPMRLEAKIRYRHPGAEADVAPAGEYLAEVRFLTAQSAIAPGQAVVFYRGPDVIGAGIIDKHELLHA